ncbi:MAG: 2-dehydro-3-deoxygalactonokinase [Burkholderiaceae bacterium]
MRSVLALDWGTSSLRGAWLDEQGQVLEQRSFDQGLMKVAAGEFKQVFERCFGDWMARPGALCLMSGMVGSQQGWLQAPYCPCPAGFEDIAAAVTWVEAGRIAIVPGLRCDQPGLADVKNLERITDVMRGEETQALGALQLLGLDHAHLVLPGTHSKWVRVSQGRIESFNTSMTGEFYALLRQHSILARSLATAGDEFNAEAFQQGIALAQTRASLLNSVFSVRSLALFERLSTQALPSYLSGLLIGDELRSQAIAPGNHVIVVGSTALTLRYQTALSQLGLSPQILGESAAWAGLWALAQTLDNS